MRSILLVLNILIARQHDLVARLFGAADQFPVRDLTPALIVGGLHLKVDPGFAVPKNRIITSFIGLSARRGPLSRRGAGAFRQQALHQERDFAFGLRVEFATGAAGETGVHTAHPAVAAQEERRSEERRVGKECRSRWSP